MKLKTITVFRILEVVIIGISILTYRCVTFLYLSSTKRMEIEIRGEILKLISPKWKLEISTWENTKYWDLIIPKLDSVSIVLISKDNIIISKSLINVKKRRMGCWLQDSESGVLITKVDDNSPAEEAQLRIGDIILELQNKKIETVDQLLKLVDEIPDGQKAEVKILRDKEIKIVNLKLRDYEKNLFFYIPISKLSLQKDTNRFLLIVNEDNKNPYIEKKEIPFEITWRYGELVVKSELEETDINLYSPSSTLYQLAIGFKFPLELSRKGDSIIERILYEEMTRLLKKIDQLLKESKINEVWDTLSALSDKYKKYSKYFPNLRREISKKWCRLGSSGLKIEYELKAYKNALEIDSTNLTAKKNLESGQEKLEKKILQAVQEYRAAKNIYDFMEYNLKYRTYSSEIYKKAEELQKYAVDVLLPKFQRFGILIKTYAKFYGVMALRDFAIKGGFLDLLE